MKTVITRAAILLLAAFALQLQSAKAQVGITAVPFLQIEPDSRGGGMGNTGVAISDNTAAIFWNPAGLGFQRGTQISVTHANWLPAFNADLFYDYLVGKTYLEDVGTLGVHVTFLNLGEQQRTDETGLELGRFNSYEVATGVSLGRQLSENWSVGLGLRYIYSSLASGELSTGEQINPGSSVGVDLATLYRSSPFMLFQQEAKVQAGLNLSNLGPGVQYTSNSVKDPLPTVLRTGWALTLDLDDRGDNTLTLANDISKVMARSETVTENGNDVHRPVPMGRALIESWGSLDRFNGSETVSLNLVEQLMFGFGTEYWYHNQFALRTGYYYEHPENGNREFLTFGAGIRYHIFGVDFSYLYTLEEDHPLANTMRFSLLLNF
ncbi:MAG: type IX secretion system outer membrane channel protein PorV [Bacteroidota bacterium]